MSHLFDLTGPSFAALRLPGRRDRAVGFADWSVVGMETAPAKAHACDAERCSHGGNVSDRRPHRVRSLRTNAEFKADGRYHPTCWRTGRSAHHLALGDQSDASSVIFYAHDFLRQPAYLVVEPCSPHGNGSSLLWGSCYPDAPHIFLSEEELSTMGQGGQRKWLFAQDKNQSKAEQLLAGRLIPVQSLADKTLWTDRTAEVMQFVVLSSRSVAPRSRRLGRCEIWRAHGLTAAIARSASWPPGREFEDLPRQN